MRNAVGAAEHLLCAAKMESVLAGVADGPPAVVGLKVQKRLKFGWFLGHDHSAYDR